MNRLIFSGKSFSDICRRKFASHVPRQLFCFQICVSFTDLLQISVVSFIHCSLKCCAWNKGCCWGSQQQRFTRIKLQVDISSSPQLGMNKFLALLLLVVILVPVLTGWNQIQIWNCYRTMNICTNPTFFPPKFFKMDYPASLSRAMTFRIRKKNCDD